jgi:hypothetical protein
MDELNLFRDFRSGVAAPSEDAHRRASARLANAIDRERTPQSRAIRLIVKRRHAALALAALAGAAAAALFVSTPWKNSPGFLARAEAALAAHAGTVLHAKSVETWTSTDPACTVTRGPNEIWIDQTPPHRYRALMHEVGYPVVYPPNGDPRAMVCSSGTATEVGGTLDPVQTIRFEPPNTLLNNSQPQLHLHPDPVTELREAISAGRAHDEGETQLGGRTVRRIRIDPPADLPPGCADAGCPNEPAYMFVDPETFYPVESHGLGLIVLDRVAWFRAVRRELTFEYLPRTEANLALTDIRAQHPNAIEP